MNFQLVNYNISINIDNKGTRIKQADPIDQEYCYNTSQDEETINEYMGDDNDVKTSDSSEEDNCQICTEFQSIDPNSSINIDEVKSEGDGEHLKYDDNTDYNACEDWKPLDQYNSKNTWNNSSSICRDDTKVKQTEYREKNPSKDKEWKEKNKNHIHEYNKKYRQEHYEELKQNQREVYRLQRIAEDPQYNRLDNDRTRRKKYFEKFKEIVQQKKGLCISDECDYINAHSKLKVQCCDGHEFEVRPNDVKRTWCPRCRTHLGEFISIQVMEYFFDKPFKKVRPSWIKTDENICLELDGYNEELKLAFEYNGIQHYEYIDFFHKGQESFEKRQEYDIFKEEMCVQNDVTLIVIPYTCPHEEIHKYIFNELQELNYDCDLNEKLEEFDFTIIEKTVSKTDKLRETIQGKGGKLIEGTYLSRDSVVKIRCQDGHEWETKISYIKRGSWCAQCSKFRTDETKEKISQTLKVINQTEKGKQIKKISHQKRSQTMAKRREIIRDNITEKMCKYHDEIHSIDKFNKKSAAADGHQVYCREAYNEIKRNRRCKTTKQDEPKIIIMPKITIEAVVPDIDNLPEEIQEHIQTFMDSKTLGRMSKTSKTQHRIAKPLLEWKKIQAPVYDKTIKEYSLIRSRGVPKKYLLAGWRPILKTYNNDEEGLRDEKIMGIPLFFDKDEWPTSKLMYSDAIYNLSFSLYYDNNCIGSLLVYLNLYVLLSEYNIICLLIIQII